MVPISDWYANAWPAEQDPAYDLANDDPIDHGPDSWLDNPSPSRTDNGHGGRPPAPRQRSADAESLRSAIRRVRDGSPGIGAREVARRLRAQGWSKVSGGQVRALVKATPEKRSPSEADLKLGAAQSPVHRRAEVCAACGVGISVSGQCRCS
jgi:hypothetical protein